MVVHREPARDRELALLGGSGTEEAEADGGVVGAGAIVVDDVVGVGVLLASEISVDGVWDRRDGGNGAEERLVGFGVRDVDAIEARGGCAFVIVGGDAEEGVVWLCYLSETEVLDELVPCVCGGLVERNVI
jgi:hypothetical protein